jgi:hypothetical protein
MTSCLSDMQTVRPQGLTFHITQPIWPARIVLDREIAPLSSSLRRDNIAIAAVSGKRATMFFFSSCLFAAGWVSQLALDIFYPVPLAVFNELRSSGPAMLLGTAYLPAILRETTNPHLRVGLASQASFNWRTVRSDDQREAPPGSMGTMTKLGQDVVHFSHHSPSPSSSPLRTRRA